jgi:agmatine deiminase
MKKLKGFFALSLLSVLSTGAFALDLNNPLPNWLDPSREHPTGKAPVTSVTRAVPPAGFHIPAEYEPVAAVVIGWAGYTDMLTSIAQAASGPGHAKVWGVAAPSSLSGVPAADYTSINLPIDSVWMRDYGPFGLENGQKPGIVDTTYRHYQERPDDDAVPTGLGKAEGIDVFPMDIILDGGNLMVDTHNDLFMTKRVYIWNSGKSQAQVDSLLKSYFGVKNIYSFEYSGYPNDPADGTGHIDMFMKLLNDHTVLLATSDEEPYKSNAEKAQAFFKGRQAPDGQPYKVIPVKGWTEDGAWFTYTNSLIVNNTAIIPSYSGHDQENAAAADAYRQGMPGVTVVQINSDNSIRAGGSIHCTTQTIPVLPQKAGKASVTAKPLFMDQSVTLPPLRGGGNSTALQQLLNSL